VHTIDLDEVTLELVVGDITDQDEVAAVVNAANAELAPGGGVAGAIHRAAGPELDRACRPLAPIDVGEAVITPGFELPNAHVVHVLGPRYGVDRPSEDLLAASYRNALALADEEGLPSIAFPAVSTGVFGYPVEEAAEVALRTVLEAVSELAHVRLVRFVLFDPEQLAVHAAVLDELTSDEVDG
jgi:O-acetyl-ADP-ribose deacetylase